MLDVDSTLIEQEVVDLLAEAAGCGPEVAAITEAAMRGELDFATSLHRRVALLAGLSVTAVHAVAARVEVTRGVSDLIAGVHAADGRVGAVSGGFGDIVDPLASRLGLDFWRANRLAIEDGVLTGAIDGPVVDAHAKRAALLVWAAQAGVPAERTVAIGDGANDLLMLAAAGLSIAFDAKPAVADAAHVVLPGRDLTPVLSLLGLPLP
ncbi:phosphoserine phosphatase SerB [uncultured Amnibacterium sp.]|uniref:phosphoserine phosphatase SerB n=1 Tax=uncultured Amnibacterium sp. TaxID=1631851 RepID=UPI0035C99DEC